MGASWMINDEAWMVSMTSQVLQTFTWWGEVNKRFQWYRYWLFKSGIVRFNTFRDGNTKNKIEYN